MHRPVGGRVGEDDRNLARSGLESQAVELLRAMSRAGANA